MHLSLFRHLQEHFGERLPVVDCTKMTLVHLSHTLEDIILREKIPALLFTGFQESGHWRKETERYLALAQVAKQICIFAGKQPAEDSQERTIHVTLTGDDPLRQEWFVCILSAQLAVVLCGQDYGSRFDKEQDRQFATFWTFEPEIVNEVLDLLEKVVEHYRPDRAADLRRARLDFPPVLPDPKLLTELTRHMLKYEEKLVLLARIELHERKQTQSQLEVRLRQQAVVAEISQRALAGVSGEELVDEIMGHIMQTLPLDGCAYWQVADDIPNTLVLDTVKGNYGNLMKIGSVIPLQPNSPVWHCFLHNQSLILSDWANIAWDRTGEGWPDHHFSDGMCVGVQGLNGKIQAVIEGYPAGNSLFTQEDRHFVETLANVLSMALRREGVETTLRLRNRAIAASRNGVTIVDARLPDMPLVYVNPAFESISGYPAQEIVGKNCRFLQGNDRDQSALTELRAAIAEGREAKVLLRNYRKDGTLFWNELSVSPIYDIEGTLTHFIGIQDDISDRQQTQFMLQQAYNELRLANGELGRASRAKDEFLAAMSHELRTPLNAILGISEALTEEIYGFLNDRQLRSIRNIEESGRHLLLLINDILDISKIESGKFTLDIEPVSVVSIGEACVRLIKQTALKKSIQVHLETDPAVKVIDADGRCMKQILTNLLSNAVKFTHDGGSIGLDITGNIEDNRVAFTVWDTGIGIANEHMDKLFKPFVQLDSSLSRQYPGTGLGLSLLYRMVELHGGSVSVKSEEGKGSRFTVLLPWRRTPQMQNGSMLDEIPTESGNALRSQDSTSTIAPQMSPTPITGLHILLAEDNIANVKMLSDYLSAKGYHIDVAWNGQEALEKATALHPDLILMDIQMPVMDGLETIQAIRRTESLQQIPIVALTALAMPSDEANVLEAGADFYMAKPVSLKALHDLIQTLSIVAD